MDKMGGVFAVRPSQGPHKLRESIPLQVILRDKFKLALNGREADIILHQKEGLVRIDKKIKRNPKYPVGFQGFLIRCYRPSKNRIFLQSLIRCQGKIYFC